MLTVACVRWGDKYGDEYVQRLKAGVARNLSLPHDFVCFTDRPVKRVRCEPLPSGLPSWWSKVALFKPGVLSGHVLYLDLDLIVTGPLIHFVRPERAKVWALDDFSYSLRVPKQDIDPATRSLLGGIGTCNSSVMFWSGDFGSDVWDKFDDSVMQRRHGDQNWITECLWPHTLELFPAGLACSYKYNVLFGTGAFGSAVVFHGHPKPADLEDSDPLKKIWLSQ